MAVMAGTLQYHLLYKNHGNYIHVQLLKSPLSPWYVRISGKAEGLNIFKKWHTGYYGTSPKAVRRILDVGDLLLAGRYSGTSLTSSMFLSHADKVQVNKKQ